MNNSTLAKKNQDDQKSIKEEKLSLLTPMIGEPVSLNDTTQVFKEWWAGIN